MEIERRFLVKDLSSLDLSQYKCKRIIQDYLYKDKFTAIRKRKTVLDDNVSFTYTIKSRKIGISVNELENEISEEEYNNLKVHPNFNHIDKIRYIIPYIDNLNIELDVFNDNFDGIVFAEIEFNSEEQAHSVKLPEWFGPEITNKLTNSDMASRPIDKILKFVENQTDACN